MRVVVGMSLLSLGLMSCATGPVKGTSSPTKLKGEPTLEAFAPEGLTEDYAVAKRHALVIGVDTFDDTRFGALRLAAQDAKVFSKSLRGFDSVEVLAGEHETGAKALWGALQRLADKATSSSDTLLVYLSSHGTLARQPGGALERYLVASDTRLDKVPGTGIRIQDLLRVLEGSKAKRRALILATCHSGFGKSRYEEKLARELSKHKGTLVSLDKVSEATIVVSASSWGEAAREDEALGHDVYTYYLMEGMKRGDLDKDGAVTLSEAHDYARTRTYYFTQGMQRPTAQTQIMGQDPIVISGVRSADAQPVLYSYDPASEGIRVLIDGQFKGQLPGGVVLEPGEHSLLLETEGNLETLYEGTVQVEPGQRHELTELLEKSPSSRPDLGGLWGVGLGLTAFPEEYKRNGFLAPLLSLDLEAQWELDTPYALSWSVSGSLFVGDGAVGAQEFLSYTTLGAAADAGVHWSFLEEEGFSLAVGSELGVWWMYRVLRDQGSALVNNDQFVAPTLSVPVDARLEAGSVLFFLRVKPSTVWLRLGSEEELHFLLAASLGMGGRF